MYPTKNHLHELGDLVHWTFNGSTAIEPDQFLGIILKINKDPSAPNGGYAKVWWILTDHTNEMPLDNLKLIELPVQIDS